MAAEFFNSLDPQLQQIILDGPALTPPKGVRPEFDDPPNRNDVAFAVVTTGLVLSSAMILLRLYSMALVARRVHIEELLAIAAFGTFVGFSYCGYRLISGTGIFVHQWDIRIRDISEFLYFVNVASSFYTATMGCLKVAILLEWLRIFTPRRTSTFFKYASYAMLVINALFYASALIAGNLSCIPQAKIWNPFLPGKCINRKKLDTANAAINVLSSLFILCLPQGVIWSLQMTTKMKMKVSMVFAIGLLAVASAVSRLVTTIQYLRSDDTSFYISGMALSCVAEQTCAIVVFCVPCIPKIFQQAKGSSKSSGARNLLATSSTREAKTSNTPKVRISQPPPDSCQNNGKSQVPLSERAPTGGFAFSSVEELYGHYETPMRVSDTPGDHGPRMPSISSDDQIAR